MRRRLLLELEIPDRPAGIMLEILQRLSEFLHELSREDVIADYGICLESDRVWVVTLRTEEPGYAEA